VREVRLEHAVVADLVDGFADHGVVVLKPEAGNHLATEVLRRLHGQLRPDQRSDLERLVVQRVQKRGQPTDAALDQMILRSG